MFTLTAGQLLDGRTWGYTLLDESRENVGRIVTHPSVEDTHFINRSSLTIVQDLAVVPRWLRSLRQRMVVRFGRTIWLWAGLSFGFVGLAAAWSFRRNPMFLILGASSLVRLMLVFSGGQFYWPDEVRFEQVRATAQGLADGRLGGALDGLPAVGLVFEIVALMPAAVERLVGQTPIIPGVFLASFSVLNIWLLKKVAQRLGAGETESLLAAAGLAMSASLFYFARHLVPYDVAITFGLLALFAGAKSGTRASSSLLCGFFAACVFLAYAGYWPLAVATLTVHASSSTNWYDVVKRGLQAGLGFAATLSVVVVTSTALGGDFVGGALTYSRAVKQGSIEEGWRLPWEYLWHSEHWLLAAWIISFIWACHRVASSAGSARLRAGLIGAASIYLMLVVGSTMLEIFVVHGRLARQLVPFLCLVTAAVLQHAFESRSVFAHRFARSALVALLVQASMNFLGPLRQSFPSEFIREGRRDERYAPEAIFVNAHHIYPAPEPLALPGRYVTVKEADHPLQFAPYQYEGYTPAERESLRATDISMRMVIPLSK